MADFVVPNYSDLIDNLNPQIAGGPPKVDFSGLERLPKSYWAGLNQQYQQRNRDLFQNGVPSNPQDLVSSIAKAQGSAAGPALMQYYKMLFGQQTDQQINGGGPAPVQYGAPSQSPQLPPSASNTMPRVANMQPGAPVPSSGRVMGDTEGVNSGLYDPPPAPGMRPPMQPDAVNVVSPNERVAQGFPSSGALVAPDASDPTLGGLVPAGRTPGQQRALLSKAVSSGMLDEGQQKLYQSQIDAIDKALGQYREGNVKNSELTQEQKNANASGTPSPLSLDRQKEVQKANIAAGAKQYEGIQAQSTQYERDLKPYLDISKSILNDPKMYSGIGGQFALDFNRVRAALGDKDAAVLQEALQKVTAASVLAQINNQRAQVQEAGGASTRIFRQQVDLVEKAAPALANTPAGNRFLVEVSSRMGDLSSRVADLAREYKNKNGYLDSGFDAKLSDYMKAHPVFTSQELTHPETLGAPTVPPQYAGNQQAFSRWASGMGLKKGDAVRLPSGRVKALDASVTGP